jgi:nitrite reductase/ring-hydroxylating ferredoxin subunit
MFAWLDKCPHAGTPLRIGKRRGEELTCMRHGWIFNLLSGQAVPDAPGCGLIKVEFQIDGSQVFVRLP